MQKMPHLHNCPPPSFQVGCDVFNGYFFIVYSANNNIHLFQIAYVLNNPNSNLTNLKVIQLQYQKSISFEYINMDSYTGWNSKEGNVWCKDKDFVPCWSYIDSIVTTWKSQIELAIVDQRMRIPKNQIFIILALLDADKFQSSTI